MLLRVERLVKTFGTVAAVNDVSFIVGKSQMICVIGRSGAGKSTLLRMINRQTAATSGAVGRRATAGNIARGFAHE